MVHIRAVGSGGGAAAALALLLLLAALTPAQAQFGGGGRGQRNQQPTPQQTPQPSQTAKPNPAVPEPWPRLEGGALLCKSRDDLVHYQTQVGNGTSVAVAQRASGCHTIRKQTGIQILDRDGQSRTEIVTTDDAKETGWTNTYLPDEPPPK